MDEERRERGGGSDKVTWYKRGREKDNVIDFYFEWSTKKINIRSLALKVVASSSIVTPLPGEYHRE